MKGRASFKPGNLFIFNDSLYAKILRLVISAVLVILCAIFNFPVLLNIPVLIIAIAMAGYDIAFKAIDLAGEGKYFSTQVFLVAVAVLSFVIGYRFDAVIAVIMYQAGCMVLDYAVNTTEAQTEGYIQYLGEEVKDAYDHSSEQIGEATQTESAIKSAADLILKFSMGFAVAFAILTPIITAVSAADSIHRALCIIIVSIPASVAFSYPLSVKIAAAAFASQGAVIQNAESIEELGKASKIIIDKKGVLTESEPHVTKVFSSVIDSANFLTFAAHAAYYSEQSFAKAITAAYTGSFKPEVLSNFEELPGRGVSVNISGRPFLLGSAELLEEKGIKFSAVEEDPDSLCFHAAVSGIYVG